VISSSAEQLISLLDLTRLETEAGDESGTEKICRKAITGFGPVAAVCVYPAYIRQARQRVHQEGIAVATVLNFPSGDFPLEQVLQGAESAHSAGASEFDVVIPYNAWKRGDRQPLLNLVSSLQEYRRRGVVLKAILETGALTSTERREIGYALVDLGVDFLKTSTGKFPVGATEEAVIDLLSVLANYPAKERRTGLKISGGVRSFRQAVRYLDLVEKILGSEFLQAHSLRLGASSLLDDILSHEKTPCQ